MAKGKNSYIKKSDETLLRKIKVCLYCGSTEDLMIDHILPTSKGGTSEVHNLTRCCVRCNSSKSDKSIEQFFWHIKEKHSELKREIMRYENIMDSILTGSYRLG